MKGELPHGAHGTHLMPPHPILDLEHCLAFIALMATIRIVSGCASLPHYSTEHVTKTKNEFLYLCHPKIA